MQLTIDNTLPADGTAGALLGRVWRPDVQGPSVVALRAGQVVDISVQYPTARDVCEAPNPAAALREAPGEVLCSLEALLANSNAATRQACLLYTSPSPRD